MSNKISFNIFRKSESTSQSQNTDIKSNVETSCRRKLNYSDDNCSTISDKSVLSVLSFSETKKALRNGAEKITKTFNVVKTNLGMFSQNFKISTKRRQILEEGPMTPGTPRTFSKEILGRTPTKLYSPFSIESPYNSNMTYDKENLPPLQKQTCLIRK